MNFSFRWRPWRSNIARRHRGPLRCQFIITSMPVGGAETLLVNLMRSMDRNVIQPEVICLKDRGPLGEQIAEEFPLHDQVLTHKWDLRIVFRLARLMISRRADAVVTVGAGDKMFWGRIAAFLAGVPVISSALHSTGWPDGIGTLNRLLTPITDAFIAVADSHGRHLHEREGFPSRKVRVIRNGVDCQRFHPDRSQRNRVRQELGIPVDGKLIGIVAALRPEKNHLALVRSAASLRQRFPTAHWMIIGDGPERFAIESLISELGLQDRVHLLGTRHDTPQLLAALDLFTLCSHNEASPVSILEALACQVPVVATDVGSIGESIRPEETGLLVPAGDESQLAEAIATMLADDERREAMGNRGRQLVQSAGSLQSMVAGYEQMITQLYDARVENTLGRRERPAEATSGFEPLKN